MRIIDISKPLRCGYELTCDIPSALPVYEGFPCEEYRFSFGSHTGCYFETSAHLFRGATMTADVPVERLFLPAVVARLDADRQGIIEPQEFAAALAEPLQPGDALIVDARGREDRFFSRDSGAWLARNQVSLLAATMRHYDTGFDHPTGVFVELFRAEIPILAETRNVDRIEHSRVFLIVLPMLIERVCCAPCRAVVLDGSAEEIAWLAANLGGQ